MRDVLFFILFGTGCIYTFKKPVYGVLVLCLVGYMNPHRLLGHWTFAYDFPVALVCFCLTGFSYLIWKNKPKTPFSALYIPVLLMVFWASICTYFALYPEDSSIEYIRFLKIQLIVLMTILIVRSKSDIQLLVLVIVLSIGFFGVKGGIFTILTGGSYRVWGPDGTFIGGNNEMALAILMIIPFFYYLFTMQERKSIKRLLLVAILLCVVSVIGSQSRGAALALVSMGAFLALKSRNKVSFVLLAVFFVVVSMPFIPAAWYERIGTIASYELDTSAMGRINAWNVAYALAQERLTGGGFRCWSPQVFSLYAPNPNDVHDVHSIYFEVMGELGFIGFFLFASFLACIWFGAKRNIRVASTMPSEIWLVTLNRMIQVSLVAYMTGGAFLGLAYWDLPYHLLAMVICCNKYLRYTEFTSDIEVEAPVLKIGTKMNKV